MTIHGARIVDNEGNNFVVGDSFGVQRTVTGLASGRTLTKAYLTVKRKLADSDTQAVLQKVITTSASSAGQITDNGSGGGSNPVGTGALIFTVTSNDSLAVGPRVKMVYSVRLILDDGEPETLEDGTIELDPSVTGAVA